MPQYYNLLKNGMVDFTKVLIDNYSLVGLDEVDCLMILKIKKLIDEKKASLNETSIIEYLVDTMSISKEKVSEKFVSLISNQYLSLENKNGIEVFSLKDLTKQLASILEEQNSLNDHEEEVSTIKKVTSFLEKEFEHLITPLELEMIKHWIDIDKYTFSDIKDAALECLRLKKKQIKYIDVILSKSKQVEEKSVETPNQSLEELFNQVYGRVKNKNR